MVKERIEENSAITLIKLVIIIVILLILAGIAIMFAKNKNGNRDTTTLFEAGTKGTTPWLPKGFNKVEETSLATGLTITNKEQTQNYIWIEVPKTISANVTRNGASVVVKLADAQTDEEILKILEAYVGKGNGNNDYTKGSSKQNYSSWKDEWYDLYNATWDGISEYALIENKSRGNFVKWKDYYGEGNVYYAATENGEKKQLNSFESSEYESSRDYFVKAKGNSIFQNHDDGCGLTYDDYQKAYTNMLNSIKQYGGFWLAQYEAGISYTEKNRTSESSRINTYESANYAKDQYPYNWVYCSEAQKIANADSTRDYTSSLPFGIQWDLICKFLEVKEAKTYTEIAENSTWGNYNNIIYTLSSTAQYSESDGHTFYSVSEKLYSKKERDTVLVTTGAMDKVKISVDEEATANPMNIYDFAGNVCEWTLERSDDTMQPCVRRGGYYLGYSGGVYTAASRLSTYTITDESSCGFRSVLY